MQTLSKSLRSVISYWWLFLLTGIILVGIGVWIFASPTKAYISLSMLFAMGMLVTGILETIFAITARKSIEGWGWTLAGGILDIIIGTYLMTYPLVTMEVLPLILGFWLLFRGASAIGFAFDIKKTHASGWGILLTVGIFILIFGIMVLAVPAFGALNIIIWTALSFIAAGLFRVILAFKLKKANRTQ